MSAATRHGEQHRTGLERPRRSLVRWSGGGPAQSGHGAKQAPPEDHPADVVYERGERTVAAAVGRPWGGGKNVDGALAKPDRTRLRTRQRYSTRGMNAHRLASRGDRKAVIQIRADCVAVYGDGEDLADLARRGGLPTTAYAMNDAEEWRECTVVVSLRTGSKLLQVL